MSLERILCRLLACGLLLLVVAPARADPTPAAAPAPASTLEAAWQAAGKTAIFGPKSIALRDQATLALPADEAFIPAAEANRIMHALGNGTDAATYGMVVGRQSNLHWMILIDWVNEGYIRDGDAKDWQADTMLADLRSGTEASNTQRVAMGYPALDIIGWVEPPAYDAKAHRLVWSISGQERGAAADRPHLVNYNTYALGRDGYFKLLLLDDSVTIDADKPIVRNLLASLVYLPGKRYEDFNGSTDKVAAYGLAALIGVVAVKKLGLLAVASVFLLKIWKVGALALIGIGAAVRKFFRRKSPE